MYLVNRGAQLLHTTDPGISERAVASRPLVQKYLHGQLGRGELEFEDGQGDAYYGFFFEIPATNVVLFRETSKANALAAVFQLAKRFSLVLALVLVVCVLLLQLPLRHITKPINELVVVANEVSKGNFDIKLKPQGFGELVTLTSGFAAMAANLVHRDRAIQTLMLEQAAKTRMERELAVAKGLQDNFFPRSMLTFDSGLVLTAAYYPAAQVAGDWFTYDYSPLSQETVIVIADVSGHDMAASMFTAILAGLFYEVRANSLGRFPMEEFGRKAGRLVRHFGTGKWHATLQVVSFLKDGAELEIMNCGHTFPLLIAAPDSDRRSHPVRLPSSPVGLDSGFTAAIRKVPFAEGDVLLLYTDGVTETRRPDGRPFGEKRLFKTAVAGAGRSAFDLNNSVHQECERYRGHTANADDLCLIALSKSA
jgi:serine phosphatase RsbU (regulator of sigma subunit)